MTRLSAKTYLGSLDRWLERDFRLLVAVHYFRAGRRDAFTSAVAAASVLGIVVGVAALILGLALLTGFQEDIQERIIGATAHVVVSASGPTLAEYEQVATVARTIPGVVAAAPVIATVALIEGLARDARVVSLKGVDAHPENRTTQLLDRIVEGSAEQLLSSGVGYPGICLGHELASALAVEVGDSVKVTIPSATMATPFLGGGIRIRYFEVVAVYDAGMFEYDAAWALISLHEAQTLVEVDGEATTVEVRVDNIFGTQRVVEALAGKIGDEYLVVDWKRANETFFAALRLEKLAFFFIVGLIMAVAALNIVSTLILSIKDKQHDIGVMLSLGATRKDILRVFTWQGALVGLVGTGLGAAFGVAVAWALDRYELIRLDAEIYYLSYLPFQLRWQDLAGVCGISLLICFLATLYPARRAGSLRPTTLLRRE